MIGYAEILNARMQGYTPEQVHIHVLENPPSTWIKRDAMEALTNGFRASILILPNENVSALNLSALLGLIVHLNGSDGLRCDAVMKQVTKYADRVLRVTEGVLVDWRATNECEA